MSISLITIKQITQFAMNCDSNLAALLTLQAFVLLSKFSPIL